MRTTHLGECPPYILPQAWREADESAEKAIQQLHADNPPPKDHDEAWSLNHWLAAKTQTAIALAKSWAWQRSRELEEQQERISDGDHVMCPACGQAMADLQDFGPDIYEDDATTETWCTSCNEPLTIHTSVSWMFRTVRGHQ
jgi:predicted RNA-binding Zn-ribbon protein involved in translation (DUF1610 family)